MPSVRDVRRAHGFSQRELAVRARVALRTIGSIEQGATCRMQTQRRLLAALGVPFERRREVFATTAGEALRTRPRRRY